MTQPPAVRVLSVPSGHAYPRAVNARATPLVVVADDPDPQQPDRPSTGVWWPHPALEPDWLATQQFDLLHLHFGFDHRTPAELVELVAFLRQTGRPLVLTVHDLRSPHQSDPATLQRQLDVLVPSADAVLTLTSWAAREIRRRWTREAVVVPHPPLVPFATSTRLRAARLTCSDRAPVVAVSCKSLRTNCDPVRLLPALEAVVRRRGARLRLLVHAEVLARPDTSRRRVAVKALSDAASRGADVVAHEPWSDADLWAELTDQDIAVLPYRFGTHSGWLEACHDVGTHVAAPSFGGYAAQGADGVYAADEDTLDEVSLIDCVDQLLDRVLSGRLAGDEPQEQSRRSSSVAATHEDIYRSALLAGRTARADQPVAEAVGR